MRGSAFYPDIWAHRSHVFPIRRNSAGTRNTFHIDCWPGLALGKWIKRLAFLIAIAESSGTWGNLQWPKPLFFTFRHPILNRSIDLIEQKTLIIREGLNKTQARKAFCVLIFLQATNCCTFFCWSCDSSCLYKEIKPNWPATTGFRCNFVARSFWSFDSFLKDVVMAATLPYRPLWLPLQEACTLPVGHFVLKPLSSVGICHGSRKLWKGTGCGEPVLLNCDICCGEYVSQVAGGFWWLAGFSYFLVKDPQTFSICLTFHNCMMEEGKKFVLGIFQVAEWLLLVAMIVVGWLSNKRLYCQH